MKNFIILLLTFIMLSSISSCNGQGNDSYWRTVNVNKIDNSPIRGITLAYMEMIADMQIHISKNNDSLIIEYPLVKKIKISELTSLTNTRIPATGQLLDSVYDVRIENNMLKIKFHYLGTGEKENRFSLNFNELGKGEYLSSLKSMNARKTKILDQITTVNLSSLQLIKKPIFFSMENDFGILNPIQLAEELTDTKNRLTLSSHKFAFFKGKDKVEYKSTGIIHTESISKTAAVISNISFNGMDIIAQNTPDKTTAVVALQNDMKNSDILRIYEFISKNNDENTMKQFGLPTKSEDGELLGILSSISISWQDKDIIIKLLIEDIPDELFDMETHNGTALKRGYSGKDVDTVFRYYLQLIKRSNVKVFIVDRQFNDLINNPENKSKTYNNPNIEDFLTK